MTTSWRQRILSSRCWEVYLGDTTFSSVLRIAIEDSGLTLEALAHELAVRGHPLSVGTLSHWQSGHSAPTRQVSMLAVDELESVLQLDAGTLRALARPQRSGGRRPLETRMAPVAASFDQGERVRALLTHVDMTSDQRLMRVSQHDRCRIGPDRAKASLLVRQVLRATADGADRFVVAFWHDCPARLPDLRPLRGCSLGKIVRDEQASVMVVELMFDHPLSRGETVVTEHEFERLSPPPSGDDDSYGRSLRHQAREYLLEVDFDPAMLPDRCIERVAPDGQSRHESRRRLHIDADGHTHAMTNGFGPGVFEIQWTWPATESTGAFHRDS